MNSHNEYRPDPDSLLHSLKKEEENSRRGKLKIFFGMSAGAGKTYDMLKSAHEARSKGIDIVIGYVETHGRPETEALTAGLEIVPRKKIEYRGVTVEEMDLDAILRRKPAIVLVDELAHTNAPTSRHTKRYQDVLELLDNAVDVYTTINVQHLESRADTVAQISGTIVRETVPDSIFEQADEVELIDISPDDLLKRLEEGKVYTPDRSQRAIEHFFRKGNLTALREMSLRLTAERVDHQLRDYMQSQRITDTWKSGQRLLVGISPSPSNVSVIRWARRMAYTMNATWIALYVETSKQLSDAAKLQLNGNIKLARELGAEIITTADEDVAQAMIRTAHRHNATQILIGKTHRRSFLASTLLENVIEQSGNLDVYVVGEHDPNTASRKRFSFGEIHSGLGQYAAASFIVCCVAIACYPFSNYLGYQTISLILLLAVALLPLKFGVGPVLLGATLSAMIWNFFFIPPHFTFIIGLARDVLMFVMYFAIAIVTSVLTARIRAREKAVRLREEHSTALFTLTKQLTAARNQNEVAEIAITTISTFFNSDVAIFLSQPDGDIFTEAHPKSLFRVDEKEFGVAAWVYWNEKKAGKFTDTLPFASATYYPITGPRYPLGVVGVRTKNQKQFTIDQESLFQNFIAQIASTLEREQLNEHAKRTVVYAESEKLYKTLFNSISHELRTPIAAIIGASENFEAKHIPDPSHMEFIDEIHTAADRLNRLVENLLDMTRLESGQLAIKRDWCDIRDIINAALKKVEKEFAGHQITITIGDDVPLVKWDFGLIEQTFTNLFHNASQYTPAGTAVTVDVSKKNDTVRIAVADNGPGFPEEAQKHLFQKFFRVPGSKAGGTGLGLSIARGFIEAHKGTISASSGSNGGARFDIVLPI
ncbi:MAG: sensor histidine kinase KdpD [Bacteroidota bacterium]|jgi:two-component system sensor histidine kinase KdpD